MFQPNHLRGLAAALLVATATLPSAALAGDEERARAAISEVKGKLSAGGQAGATGEAAETRVRAERKLAEADVQLRKDNHHNAYHAARYADALAELAQAQAELRNISAPR